MDYAIRRFRDADAEQLSELARLAISQIGIRAYNQAQVAAWLNRHPGPQAYRDRDASWQIIVVAAERVSGSPVAYALLERDGHLDRLYVHPAHSRKGLADRLLAEAEQCARAIGVTRLYTEASDLARSAFERAGYTVIHRREFAIDGVQIHNWAMEKTLDQRPG